jgi:cell division FtsZ-interacting protein ZapD
LEQQLTEGIDRLSRLPQSLDEVAEASQAQLQAARQCRTVRDRLAGLDDKNQTLRAVFSAPGVDQLRSVRDQFDRFQTLLEGHELVGKTIRKKFINKLRIN